MLLLWRLCLLSITVAGLRPRRPDKPYLGAWQNDTSGSWNYTENSAGNFTVPDIPNLCGLGPPGDDNVTEISVTRTFATCSNCATVSGVIVGIDVPTDLIPTNETAPYLGTGASDTDVNNKRAPLTHMPQPTLMPRAPQAIPLAQPESGEGKQEKFMYAIKDSIEEDNIFVITPQDEQLASWKITLQINGKKVETPIGVTGIWYEWPKEPTNYKMVGMHGCTGVIIVGNTGFWVGHWWESTAYNNVNGGSSFNYRGGPEDGDVMVRPLEDFKTIATKPLLQPSPPGANSFVSLYDLKYSKGDPFGRANGGADIYIITKSAGTSPREQKELMYEEQITALQTALKRYVRYNKVVVRPYIGDDSTFPEPGDRSTAGVPNNLNGVSIVLFSPYAGTSEKGVPEARAMVWSELNEKPDIDRKWEVCLGGANNKRDGAACALPVAMPSSALPIQSPLPCTPHQDPDYNIQGQCACNNGVNIPMVITTDAAGSTKGICPWTTIPPQALTTPMPDHPDTVHLQYQYTYTDISKRVIECETYSVGDWDGPVSYCVGSTALLHQPPTATIEMGSSKVNVGTVMTGKVLFTSISNAVKSLCPTPTSSGAWTSCETGTIKVGPASYINSGKPEDGDLTIHVLDAQYNTTDYLDLFTFMLAGAANASATGSNCELIDWAYNTYLDSLGNKRDINGREFGENQPIHHAGSNTFCNMNSFFGTQFMDGVQETAKMFFEAEFGFELADFGNFDCSSTVSTVGEILEAIFLGVFPEFLWLLETGVELGELACKAAETFHTSKTRRQIESDPADAKLARAWEKEMRKERMLPMPEHKKRELGLID